jgi:NifU-like protein involved in Fe-S cluster formation
MSRTPGLTLLLAISVSLAGCGAETIGTAAVVATQKQQEIEQAQQLKESVQQQLDAAQALEQQRLKDMQAQ